MSDIDRIQDLQDTLAKDEQNFQARRELALILLDNGYSKEALQHLLYLKEFFSDDSGIYYNLGIVYEKIKQYNKATDAYQTAIKLAPEEADAYFNLGLVYIEQKKYDEGIECFKNVLKVDENDSNTYFSLGICYFKKGDLVEIIDAENNYVTARGLAEKNSDEIKSFLGAKRGGKKCGHKDVVVHRDNLAIV